MTHPIVQSNKNIAILWRPVLRPVMTGGLLPVGPVAVNESASAAVVLATVLKV